MAPTLQFSAASRFSLRDLEHKLKQVHLVNPAKSLPSPPSSDSGSTSRIEEEPDYFLRSYSDCLAIYEDPSRSKSESLALLSDEEVILLANHGKIPPYALEKLFGMDQLERAVSIRRAIICKFAICIPPATTALISFI
jgi:hydroxymethylglutaryl-CoA reductase (NADPH)